MKRRSGPKLNAKKSPTRRSAVRRAARKGAAAEGRVAERRGRTRVTAEGTAAHGAATRQSATQGSLARTGPAPERGAERATSRAAARRQATKRATPRVHGSDDPATKRPAAKAKAPGSKKSTPRQTAPRAARSKASAPRGTEAKRSRAKTSGKPRAALPLDAATLLALYEKMVLLRRFESAAQTACRKGETPGFLHLYIGEEATAVGVCAHLRPSDWITSTHRGHGHALAKGMAPRILMAELFGKRDGCCGGRGGTMHLYDRAVGLFGTNGIVAAGIGHAAGAGISARIRKTDDVAVAFFGDGAVNHGGFHESINFAAIQRAATVFVCENNLYATATPLTEATLNTEIASRAAAYGIPGVAVDGNDVLAVHAAMRRRGRAGPARRRSDADRGEDLPHRRPPRRRSGCRLLPHPGGDRRLARTRSRSPFIAGG